LPHDISRKFMHIPKSYHVFVYGFALVTEEN